MTTAPVADPGARVILGPLPPHVSITTWARADQSTAGKVTHHTWPELVNAYSKAGDRVRAKADLRAPVFATVRDECTADDCDKADEKGRTLKRHRCDQAVTAVHALTFDHDDGSTWEPAATWCRSRGLACILYESPSHMVQTETGIGPRWRIVIPLSQPWTDTAKWSRAYSTVRLFIEAQIGVGFDRKCSNPSRIFYPPTRPTADVAPRRVVWIEGAALDLPATLATMPQPKEEPANRTYAQADASSVRDLDDDDRVVFERWCQGAFNRAREAVAQSGKGERNDTLNAQTFALVSRFGSNDLLNVAMIERVMLEAAKQAGLPEPEASKTIASASSAGKANATSIRDLIADWRKNRRPSTRKRQSTMHEQDSTVTQDSAERTDFDPDTGEVLPEIKIGTDEYRVNEETIAALAAGDRNLYQRHPGVLVTVKQIGHDPTRAKTGLRIADDALVIRNVNAATLRERISQHATFLKYDKRSEEWGKAHVPDWTTNAVLSRIQWARIPGLRGIAEYPVMRPDGSILSVSGYDPETCLFLNCNVAVNVSANPTQTDAMLAAKYLMELQHDFPHKDDQSRAAWVCGLLTPLARPAIEGPTPAFIINKNIRGCGGTLEANLIGLILTGREMPAQSYPRTEDEMEKVLVSMALQGTPFFSFDNVTTLFGGGALDKWLTSTRPSGRILGVSENPTFDWTTVLYATANNCAINADTDRRSLYVRLESEMENPEGRTGWRIPSIKNHVQQHRAEYLAAALTILRAYAVAGREPVSTREKGSFESWGRVVRDAVVWAGLPDPELDYSDEDRPPDADKNLLGMILSGWVDFAGKEARTVAQALKAMGYQHQAKGKANGQQSFGTDPVADDKHATLREAFSLIDPSAVPSAVKIGQTFKRLSRRYLEDRRLVRVEDKHTKVVGWRVARRGES